MQNDLRINKKGGVFMASEKNVTTVRDEDKNFIRAIMSLTPGKRNLIQGIIIGLDLQEKKASTADK